MERPAPRQAPPRHSKRLKLASRGIRPRLRSTGTLSRNPPWMATAFTTARSHACTQTASTRQRHVLDISEPSTRDLLLCGHGHKSRTRKECLFQRSIDDHQRGARRLSKVHCRVRSGRWLVPSTPRVGGVLFFCAMRSNALSCSRRSVRRPEHLGASRNSLAL